MDVGQEVLAINLEGLKEGGQWVGLHIRVWCLFNGHFELVSKGNIKHALLQKEINLSYIQDGAVPMELWGSGGVCRIWWMKIGSNIQQLISRGVVD